MRTFGYGFTGVLLAIYLSLLGGGREAVVASLAISLVSGAGLNIAIGFFGDRFGRRRAVVALGLLMALAGAVLATAPTFPIALIALALGATSPTGTEVSPFLSIEQSIVAEVAREGRRTRAFATYNLLGSFGAAAGGLAGGIPLAFLGSAPSSPDPIRPMFAVYAILGLTASTLGALLPRAVEVRQGPASVRLTRESRTRVAKLSVLFAADSFAGGFVVQSFVSYWFFVTYPESHEVLGVIFFLAGTLAALSFVVAARLGERIGLLETIVATHIPSNVLLVLVPLAPGFMAALALYLARMGLSQMDVPTRQAYLAGIVAREERTAANAATNTARSLAQAGGPVSASGVLPLLGLSAPFFLGGTLKIAYDLAIFFAFRGIRPSDV